MLVLVTGASGQLGRDVIEELTRRNIDAVGVDINTNYENISGSRRIKFIKLDITNKSEVYKIINETKPDAIIHCAAWTNVDGAEEPNNKRIVEAINVEGTNNLVQAASSATAKFMYISTDYVFDGKGTKPWKPDDKNYSPLNFYGLTKLKGEETVSRNIKEFFVVRIAWVFGLNGNNFVKTMLNLADKGYKELKVVDDQIGTPTYTCDLAKLLVDMIQTNKYGYYHVTNEGGYISWADYAEEIFKQSKRDIIIRRVSTSEYGLSIAKRPSNSRLDKSKLLENGFEPLPDWRDALKRYLNKIIKEHL